MDIKLIAADLDDTLMRPDKSISGYSADILRRCREERGIPVCFVTARSLKSSASAINIVSPEYLVTSGGALCLYGNDVLLSIPLEKAAANEIIRFCMRLGSVKRFQAETVKGDYYVCKEIFKYASGDYAHAEYYDFSRELDRDVYKLVIGIADENDRRELADRFPNARIFNYVGGDNCFIASNKATKLRGMEVVACHMGIGLEAVAAFGDDIGDADYLSACGYGVAVENSVPAARQAARFICGSNDVDGAARWIEENVLQAGGYPKP